MSLIIEGGVPARWADIASCRPAATVSPQGVSAVRIRLALINNMPDAALEDTELQFFELLERASAGSQLSVRLYSLPGIARGERAQMHLRDSYFGLDDLWRNSFDGIVITGTEPHHRDLRDEPYWKAMTEVFAWAEENTVSAIFSCLAAHASVLHSDGILRCPLPDKRFGVFQSTRISSHGLMDGLGDLIGFPHSRWNDIPEEDLAVSGYTMLARSGAGADLFVKKRKRSLFVHFQGHPEYATQTLLKEYRRDIKRFLRGERDHYPTVPCGYFAGETVQVLSSFREECISQRHEECMASFPRAASEGLQNTWQASAAVLYRNWLEYIAENKEDPSVIAAAAASSVRDQQKPALTR